MNGDASLALFLMLGQTAERAVGKLPSGAPPHSLRVSDTYDLATVLPDIVRQSSLAAEPYRLMFVFENYLRELMVDVLTKGGTEEWWSKLPSDVKSEIESKEMTEEAKQWMALGARDRSALLTYPQLLATMEQLWKEGFGDLLRDKTLIQQARALSHLRNTVCHMTPISAEEIERIKQTMRDWFRMAAP